MIFDLKRPLEMGIIATFLFAVWVGVVLWILPKAEPDPGTILPAKSTIALFMHVDQKMKNTLIPSLPEAASMPIVKDTIGVALLKKNEKQNVWVSIKENDLKLSLNSDDKDFLHSLALIEEPDQLANNPEYRSLTKKMIEGPYAYLVFPNIAISPFSAVGRMLRPEHPVVVQPTIDGLSVQLTAPNSIDLGK